MTKPSDNPADPFKKALTEATKALAHESELTISYSVDPPGQSNSAIRLPQVSRKMTREEVMIARGTADAFALKTRFHNQALHAKYSPSGPLANELFESLETARCEALGARAMPGTARNIDTKISADVERLGYAHITDENKAPIAAAAGFLLRKMLTGRELPAGAQNVIELCSAHFDANINQNFAQFSDVFGRSARVRPHQSRFDRSDGLWRSVGQ